MKASELVEKLQKLIEEHGDKPVTVNGAAACEANIYDVDNWPEEFTLWISEEEQYNEEPNKPPFTYKASTTSCNGSPSLPVSSFS